MDYFMDVDTPVLLAKNGFNYFAHVPSSGFYHVNFKSIFEIPKKKFRNIDKNFLPNYETRQYRYFDIKDPRDKLKIFFWIIYANLFFPSLIKGIYKAVKKRNWVMLYEPFAALMITDSILFGFLRNKLSKKLFKDLFVFSK